MSHALNSKTLLAKAAEAVTAAERLGAAAKIAVRERVAKLSGIDKAQDAAHGYAWLATYVEAVRQLAAYAERLEAAGHRCHAVLDIGRITRVLRDAGRLSAEQGLLLTLPQVEDLGWGEYFPDKEFLFHVQTRVAYKFAGERGVEFSILLVSLLLLLHPIDRLDRDLFAE